MEYWSDEVDHRPAKDGIDDPGPIHGKIAMRKHIRDWIDTFDDFWFEAVELIDADRVDHSRRWDLLTRIAELLAPGARFGGRSAKPRAHRGPASP